LVLVVPAHQGHRCARWQFHEEVYYDNGQKEPTNLVNSVFNAHLSNVEERKVAPVSGG